MAQVMIDGAARNKTPQAGITADAGAVLNYSKPAVQTYSGANQQWDQPSGTISPYSNMAQPGSNQQFDAGTNTWGNPAAQAPAAPSGPPVGGAQWYGGLDAGGRASADQQWLGGDSDYTSQVSEYDRALQSFIDRIAGKKKMFNQDADDAMASTGRNQSMSLDNLGEDFGARGLAYSGLFDKSKQETNTRFNDAKGGIEKVRSRNLSDASNQEEDYRSENSISKTNAERASLARQAQRQALIDQMGGF